MACTAQQATAAGPLQAAQLGEQHRARVRLNMVAEARQLYARLVGEPLIESARVARVGVEVKEDERAFSRARDGIFHRLLHIPRGLEHAEQDDQLPLPLGAGSRGQDARGASEL